MIANRSVPSASVVPVLAYHDVAEAAEWLCRAFGFKLRLRIGAHRAQLVLGNGAVIVVGVDPAARQRHDAASHQVHVRVENADAHHQRAKRSGARIVSAPADYPYGERQYTAEDLGGHRWTFSESIADVDPSAWGGSLVERA